MKHCPIPATRSLFINCFRRSTNPLFHMSQSELKGDQNSNVDSISSSLAVPTVDEDQTLKDTDNIYFSASAIQHISNNINHFTTLSHYDGEIEKIDGSHAVEGSGTVYLTSLDNTHEVHLDDVLYVPGALKNVISIGRSIGLGISVIIKSNGDIYYNEYLVGRQVSPGGLFTCIYKPHTIQEKMATPSVKSSQSS